MRIISGYYRGRTIKFPKSKLVRPTTDKNKEAMFNWLNNRIDFDEITACDIYAGSGSLGLEILSRGADEVHFIEKDFHVYKMLTENINSLDAMEYCKVFKTEALRFSQSENHIKYDLIIADPPFFKDDILKVVPNLLKNGFLAEDGMLMVERSIQTEKEDLEGFLKEPIKRLGDSLIYVFYNEDAELYK